MAATAFKTLPLYVPGLGLGMRLQLAPSQCMVNVCKGIALGSSESELPTAQTSFAEMAATPFSTTNVFPTGFGLATTLQLRPSQCSVRVCLMYRGVPLTVSAGCCAHSPAERELGLRRPGVFCRGARFVGQFLTFR